MNSSETNSEIFLQQFIDAIRKPAERQTDVPPETLEWLALVPAWPEQVVEQGFPGDLGLITGSAATEMLQELVDDGWLDAVNASPPWSGKSYWMNRTQRKKALQFTRNRPRALSGSLLDEARRACRQLLSVQSRFEMEYSPALRYWCALLQPESSDRPVELAEIADRLNRAVEKALRKARALGLDGSPEAASILDAAEPLVTALGGPLRVAAARSQRELELHHRRSRDQALLRNYQDRRALDLSFEELLSSDSHSAIHYMGGGGVGKTMFLRHLQSTLAAKWNLASARVDFDHLNPDYPLRSPGLLLLSFAEELKLEAPEAAIDYFRKLVLEVNQVHANLEAARREGREVPLGFSAPRFDFCQMIFVEALQAIERARKRPVLILDTCEELVRLRFDGKLPRTVVETFLILEDLHRRLPSLRVVLSGRRPLSRTGSEADGDKVELPLRTDLVVFPILGFNREEALELLRNYRRTENGRENVVPAELHEGILQLSRATDDNSSDRCNPFDVDLYAAWAAADNTLTADQLRKAGRHHYVRERIVARLRDDIRIWVPHLAILGRFDEQLILDLAANINEPAGLWGEMRQQEWVDVDRSALGAAPPLNDEVSQTGRTAFTFWNVDQQMQKRLQAYYRDELPGVWSDATRQLTGLLERITIDRDWPFLTPSYFQVAAELMRADPGRAARWWIKVEEKILGTGAWGWADRITASLLGNWGSTKETHPLDAPVRALRANVHMQSSVEDETIESLWLATMVPESYPDVDGRRVLQFRARAGFFAHLRYRSQALGERDVHEFQATLERMPSLEQTLSELSSADTGALRRQLLYTEIALLDNSVEVMEQVDWSSPPPPAVIELIIARANELARHLSAEGWVGVYIQRLKLLAGSVDEHWSWLDAWNCQPPDVLQVPAFDYVPPENPETRRLLECGRILEGGKIRRFVSGFAEEALRRARGVASLDEDRLVSQALRFMPELRPERAVELVSSSMRLAGQREKCEAHKKVPPLYVTVIQVMSAAGDVDAAINLIQQARSSHPSEQVVRWLNRVAAHVNKRYLLAESQTEDVQLRELPFSDDTPNPVTIFMNATAANLGAVQEGHLTAEDLARETQLAEGICARQGFGLPAGASDLQAVTPGWRPWFIRYLIVRRTGEGTLDASEREAIKGVLKSLYETDLPPDVAFLEPKKAAPAPKRVRRPYLPLIGGLAVIFFCGALWVIDRAGEWVTGVSLSWWQDLLILLGAFFALLGVFFVIGISSIALPRLLRLYTRAIRSLVSFASTVSESKDGFYSIQSETRIAQSLQGFVLSEPKPIRKTVQFSESALYATAADQFNAGEPIRTSLRRWTRWLIARLRMNHVLVLTEPSSRHCWEAVLGMSTGISPIFSNCPFLYRRMTDKRWRVEKSFPGSMTIISVSAIRDLSPWNEPPADARNIKAYHFSSLPNESNRQAGVLIVQAEVTIGDTGIRFATHVGSRNTFGAEDVARLFPNLRLLVLLSHDRGEATARTSTDRLLASNLRAAAHELSRVSAPAVICIPGLLSRTTLVEETLKIIRTIVRQELRDAVPPLQEGVRKIQDRIFADSELAPADATELAYDVCFYAADHINMKIDTTAGNFENLGRRTQA